MLRHFSAWKHSGPNGGGSGAPRGESADERATSAARASAPVRRVNGIVGLPCGTGLWDRRPAVRIQPCCGAGMRRVYNILSLIHISEPTRLGMISYAVFCLKKKKK